jgi:hypothetical protein
MDKRTGIAAAVIGASAGLAGVEVMRRRVARSETVAVPGIRADTRIYRERADYSPGPRANPELEREVVDRGEEAWARVLGH